MQSPLTPSERAEARDALGLDDAAITHLLSMPDTAADLTRLVRSGRIHGSAPTASSKPLTLTPEQRAAAEALGVSESEYVATLWHERARASGYTGCAHLTDTEREVCSLTGVSPEEFLATKGNA